MCSSPRKPAAEAEPQRRAVFRLEADCGVVEAEFLQSVAQVGVLVALHRVQPAEDHRLDLAKAWQRLFGGAIGVGNRVANLGVLDRLDGRRDVAHLARVQPLGRAQFRREVADLGDLEGLAVGHEHNLVAGFDAAVHYAHIGDHADIGVVVRVVHQRAQRGVRVAAGGRHALDDGF
jgi:hypothetical protein